MFSKETMKMLDSSSITTAENLVNGEASTGEDEECVVEANVEGRTIRIDKRDDSLIITNECKRIMRNLCSAQSERGNFDSGAVGVTQPSFLSYEDRILFFKTKMFYLLQERHRFLHQDANNKVSEGTAIKKLAPAEAYAGFLSPFCENVLDMKLPGSHKGSDRKHRGKKVGNRKRKSLDGTDAVSQRSSTTSLSKLRGKAAQNPQKTGMIKFLEHIRKADQSTMHMLEEKILKTIEGAGYATLLRDKDKKKMDVILAIFPDYNRLLQDGNDEESKLNNLVTHVRTRIKYFDKLQSFYENPSHEDHTAHVFAMPNLDAGEVRAELSSLKPKRLHHLDEKKIQVLYSLYKDDYSTAKTTLIADGTQPVVLNRKKLDRVKKYVDDCAEWKGNMLVPYGQETNFFFLMFPWNKTRDSTVKKSEQNEENQTSAP